MIRPYVVLFADPDVALGESARAALEADPRRVYEVRVVSEGAPACRIIGTERVHVAIVGDGLVRPVSEDIISAFSADADQVCRFVALVGWPVLDSATRMFSAGARACLTKSFTAEALRSCVEENLKRAIEATRRAYIHGRVRASPATIRLAAQAVRLKTEPAGDDIDAAIRRSAAG